MSRLRIALTVIGALAIVIGALAFTSHRCVSAMFRYGVDIPMCPAGEVHVVLDATASGLRRGQRGFVQVNAHMVYVVGEATNVSYADLVVKDPTIELLRGDKSVTKLTIDLKDAPKVAPNFAGFITLPADLQDGDYVLRIKASTKAGDGTVDVNLPVYAPAKIHALTDRPLYEPGHTIKFRAVVLRARDLVPLDGRPGRFKVIDPQGTVVLDERADAGEFGIADGELPLDKSSPEGAWHVRYESGGAVDDVVVAVKPFTLPRFTVDVTPSKPFYRAKDEPRVRIHVAYASGAPTQAALDVTWSVNGRWPAPLEWITALPKSAKTGRDGRAELVLPRVPADLMGKIDVTATVTAHDDTGDEQTGTGGLMFAEDAIDVDIVTELGAHTELVEGVNNRAYIRATTAAGVPLPSTTLTVKRAWDAKDKGVTVDTDEDGVASLQIDPGPAVNILIPAMPIRLPPPPPVVERTSLSEMMKGSPTLAEIAAFDRLNPAVARCARFSDSGADVGVVLHAKPSGAVSFAAGEGDAARCIAAALEGTTLPAGGARIFQAHWRLDPPLAHLSEDAVGSDGLPDGLAPALAHAMLDARECLGRMTKDAQLPRAMAWEVKNGRFSAEWETQGGHVDEPLDAGKTACVESKLASAMRARTIKGTAPAASEDGEEQSGKNSTGAVRFTVQPVPLPAGVVRPAPTTMLGYELAVSARAGDEAIGSTKLRVTPGQVPPVRLRASKVIADPGDDIVVEILRGPDFHGKLPKKLVLSSVDAHLEEDVDEKTRSAHFKLPADKDGWYEARFDSGLARVFVPRRESLLVDIAPDKRAYKPGEHAKLAVTTKEHDKGVKAAVGLFGVDDTLSQLAVLPTPGAMERLAPTVTMDHKAFGAIDATALALGRVRGKNAAAATVLLVSAVPVPEDLDVTVSASATTPFDPLLPLADRFYTVLDALYAETRKLEATAPKDDKITPQKMLELWDRALDDAAKKGTVTDAFGRRLRLPVLPDDLIALTDPRLVVADGTRLPEDVEAWIPFVKRSAR